MNIDKINYNNYKIFVFDLDYTLYLHEHHTSVYTEKIINLLMLLKQNEKILCIATHNKRPYYYLSQIKSNIDNFFDKIVFETKDVYPSVNSIKDYTSKKTMLNEIIDTYNCNTNEIIFFDDSNHNINEVTSLGITSLKVSNHTGIDTDIILSDLNNKCN